MPQTSPSTSVVDATESADRHAFEAALAAETSGNKRPAEGDLISGVIAGITPDLVLVSIGGKSEALMDLHELDGEKVGDRIEAVVIKASPEVRLSRRLAVGRRTKAELHAAAAARIPVAGKVVLADPEPERQRAEDALKEAESRLKTILHSIHTGIVVIDAEHLTIVDANEVAVSMTGYPLEMMIGSPCHEFICPTKKGDCPCHVPGDCMDNAEHLLLTSSGEAVPVLKTVSTIILGGRPHFLESYIDITERKKADLALKAISPAFSHKSDHHLVQLGLVDALIPEPGEGAHTDWDAAAEFLKQKLIDCVAELSRMSPQELVDGRYKKFRAMGNFFTETAAKA